MSVDIRVISPSPLIFPLNVDTPAMETLSKFVCPSTSKSKGMSTPLCVNSVTTVSVPFLIALT